MTRRGHDDDRSRRQLSLHGRDGLGHARTTSCPCPRPRRALTGYTATTTPTFRSYPDVSGGGAYLNADFGFRGTGVTTYSIQDRVWLDTNGDGLFASESGIAGVTMELLNASLQVIGTTTTAADGTFTFSGLAGGGADYTTRITDTSGVLVNYFGTTSYAQARQRAESNLVANLNRTAAPSYGFLPRAASATRSSTTSTAMAFRTRATTGSPGSW